MTGMTKQVYVSELIEHKLKKNKLFAGLARCRISVEYWLRRFGVCRIVKERSPKGGFIIVVMVNFHHRVSLQ